MDHQSEASNKIRVGITHGDINGIGYEVIIKSLMDTRIFDMCTPIIYGSPKIAAYHRKALNISKFSMNHIPSADKANPKRANVVNCVDDNTRVELGKSTTMAGKASLNALEKATEDLQEGHIDVLVTAPINKNNIQAENFKFPGHTEYLANKFSETKSSVMLMVRDWLRVGVVTGHIPLSEVHQYITRDNILTKLRLLNQSLIQDFAIQRPVIAVLGINPHAGDHGLIGKEEQEILIPALEEAGKENIMALGPYPADGFFGNKHLNEFNAVLAMYHDQGLAPFKTIAFDEGVNFTAGLDMIRTSPAHGTAYEIAGKNQANESSFRQAIYLAINTYKNRMQYKKLLENQLEADDNNEQSADLPS